MSRRRPTRSSQTESSQATSVESPSILWEDDAIVVVVKPAGLPTANVPSGEASLYRWLQARWGQGAFVGIVSRLDAAVSGVIVAARSPAAAAGLAAQFRHRQVTKRYAAVIEGRFPAPLDAWQQWRDVLERTVGSRRSVIVSGSAGRRVAPATDGGPLDDPRETDAAEQSGHAETRARVVRRCGEVSLVELEPRTGRRHQLRVQLAGRGCPIVGDRLYGSRLPFIAGIALHADSLDFRHPIDGRVLHITAPRPDAWMRRFPALLSGHAAGIETGDQSGAGLRPGGR
jgi:23S rRNA pseudouridine1911/1915/1917 synthase